jgi:hypothetical protein
MKWFAPLVFLLAGIVVSGCVHHRAVPATVKAGPVAAIVTPGDSLTGKVVAYNAAGRFVVLNFPSSQMPQVDQTLFLYRAGLKVAEIKITGPQNDDNTVADVVTGEAQAGDEVRDH